MEIVGDFLYIIGVADFETHFFVEQVGQCGLRSFDLRGEQRLFANCTDKSQSTDGTSPDTPAKRASASLACRFSSVNTSGFKAGSEGGRALGTNARNDLPSVVEIEWVPVVCVLESCL